MKQAKIILHPEAIVAEIRKATTHAAGVMHREMEALAKKFPDHFFEVEIFRQELPDKVHYRANIKTFKKEQLPRTPTKSLLDLVCEQELDLDDYLVKLQPLIAERFVVKHLFDPTATPIEDLIRTIIYWERGDKESSLELRLNKMYIIEYK